MQRLQAEPPPRMRSLGLELLASTRGQRNLALLRPLVWTALAFLIGFAGLLWLTPIPVFFLFVAVVTATHDVVHGSLGLGRRTTELALFALGALLLESGHAYRSTHLRHHEVFPGPDDPEGDPARMSFWGAVLHGPFFLPRLWWWAFARARGQGGQRAWLILEAGWASAALAGSAALLPWHPFPFCFAAQVVAGGWVYSLLTVHLPHRHYGSTPLEQTSTLRGWIIPRLFLELTYHLEHHLYPQVPSHCLPELSRRLEPYFSRNGVRPRRVP